jgi:hypothetical protein
VLGAVKSGSDSPFLLDELVATSRVTFAILESIRTGVPIAIGEA